MTFRVRSHRKIEKKIVAKKKSSENQKKIVCEASVELLGNRLRSVCRKRLWCCWRVSVGLVVFRCLGVFCLRFEKKRSKIDPPGGYRVTYSSLKIVR